MKPNHEIENNSTNGKLEVVVGIFATNEAASRVAASLRGPDTNLQRVSRTDPAVPNNMPEIVYDSIEEIGTDSVTKGAVMGGAIGATSGLLFLGIPGLNVAAPLAGALAGSWIGAVAGIDEANRGIELPNQGDYRRMLANGKSFVVIAGDEAKRQEYGNKMVELGAEDVHQHPPINQIVRKPG